MFEIKEHGVVLEFPNDVRVVIDPYNPKTADSLVLMASKASEVGLEEIEEDEDLGEYVGRILKEVSSAIESILGEGTLKQIFGDTPIGIFHLVDIIVYIDNQIAQYKKEFTKEYSLDRINR